MEPVSTILLAMMAFVGSIGGITGQQDKHVVAQPHQFHQPQAKSSETKELVTNYLSQSHEMLGTEADLKQPFVSLSSIGGPKASMQ